jgi:hypothetical protein
MKHGETFKSVHYRGKTIEFERKNQKVWARVPSYTRQYVGYGMTKRAAVADAKGFVDMILAAKKNARK